MSSATQSQLARRLGLSRSTVAAALNPNSAVKLREETRERILREAKKQKYRPNRSAQLMRGQKSGLIGVFQFGGLSQVAAERVWHASNAIREAGYKVLSTDLSWSSGGVKAACEAMLDSRTEGVLVAGFDNPAASADLQALRHGGMPMVTLSGNEISGVPHLRGDAREAVRQIVQHFVALGKKRLLFLMHHSLEIGPGMYLWASRERFKGFEEGVREAGGRMVTKFSGRRGIQGRIETNESMFREFDPYVISKGMMSEVLWEDWRPDAVICGNDDWAIGAMAATRERGLSIPGDIGFVGYDNTAQGMYLDVPLTSVEQPSREMAASAVKMLMEMIEENKIQPSLTQFPCRLIVRRSCGGQAD